ncbi:hypothetical protein N7447_005591 [Penicillium robsamsonii]|uniref:uncharacterized protein n=1 Tax=Penicillium robsamsonii TaxID=1792511 RepID=UPI00254739C3|nr:uncharacterized protein N7447_005591 [Penicillium robsamsonii]KAJ5823251.1 hypothetical protein N7447_005591 [Penicillium robsamsonii]
MSHRCRIVEIENQIPNKWRDGNSPNLKEMGPEALGLFGVDKRDELGYLIHRDRIRIIAVGADAAS